MSSPARPPPSPVVEQVPRSLQECLTVELPSLLKPACPRVTGLTVLQQFFLGFGCGSVIVWGLACLQRGSYRTRPYYYRFARSWQH